MAPSLVALAQKNTQFALLQVDIASWDSPVAKRYQLRSIPHLKVYDGNGRLLAEGKDAYRYIK